MGRTTLFDDPGDYSAFGNILIEAVRRDEMRLIGFAIMPHHWRLVVWPWHDGDRSEFVQWLTLTHVRRWHARGGTGGTGPIDQGRFKSFPVQHDDPGKDGS